MSNEDEICCSNCGVKCEQSLMLSCDHNLCMNCAAENLVRNESPGVNKTQFVICDVCQTKTEIDTKTSKEVLSLGLNNLNKKNANINELNKIENINNTNTNQNYFPILETSNSLQENLLNFNTSNNLMNSNNLGKPVNIVYFNTNNSNSNNNNLDIYSRVNITEIKDNLSKSNICKEHGEPITYLCLDCMSRCVCAECVVHGIHRNHEVLNIKKAYPLIYNKTQEIGNLIGNRIKELNAAQNNIEQKKKDINFLNNKCKIDIRQAFDELRSLLNRKEKEIITKTENTLNDNLNELNTYSHLIQSKILLLNKLIETVNAYLMRKDELTLINFYTENKNKILAQSEINELNNINNINIEGMASLRVDIDKSSFDAMISAINTLNFEINTFKGIDFGNQYNLGKFTANRNLYGNNFINDNNIIGINEVNVTETVNSLNEKNK